MTLELVLGLVVLGLVAGFGLGSCFHRRDCGQVIRVSPDAPVDLTGKKPPRE